MKLMKILIATFLLLGGVCSCRAANVDSHFATSNFMVSSNTISDIDGFDYSIEVDSIDVNGASSFNGGNVIFHDSEFTINTTSVTCNMPFVVGKDDIIFNTTSKGIRQQTADGSDNQIINISGGGAFLNSRGATIELDGNEAGGNGSLYLNAGNVSGGDIVFKTQNATRMTIEYAGQIICAGGMTFQSKTNAELYALTPATVGEAYWNSTRNKLYIATGTAACQFAASDDYTTGPGD
jgi:hypothetical protein